MYHINSCIASYEFNSEYEKNLQREKIRYSEEYAISIFLIFVKFLSIPEGSA